MLESGRQFGHYRIQSALGAGGMGEVYLARDESLDRKVALKFLPEEFTTDEARVQRFKQEARAASALNHPFIITIYEIIESDEGTILATEYIDGVTLRERLGEEKRLSPVEALKIAGQIADALQAAHEARIVHRDIKPENIMIRRDGFVKVLDFGLAKLVSTRNAERGMRNEDDETLMQSPENNPQSAIPNPQLTSPGMILGSVRYMSPEQARGKSVDGRTDVWSLGVILYEMLAGAPPFDGETMTDTLAAVIHKEPPPVSKFAAGIPAELQRIVRKTLQKDCDERYQTVKDLAIDLKNLRREIERGDFAENKTETLPAQIQESGTPAEAHNTTQPEKPTETQIMSASSGASNFSVQTRRGGWLTVAFVALLGAIALAASGWAAYRWFGGEKSGEKKTALVPFQNMRPSIVPDWDNGVMLAVSPDAKYIAYTTDDGTGNNNLKIRQTATGITSELLPMQPGTIQWLEFAPDGDYIYYNFYAKGAKQAKLFRLSLIGGAAPREIVNDVGSNISFAPDGKRFAFKRHNPEEDYDWIMIASVDGSGEPQPLVTSKKTGHIMFLSPAWSPDGAKIVTTAVNRNTDNEEAELLEVSVSDGSRRKPLETKKIEGLRNIRWLKDGSGLILNAWEKSSLRQIWHVAYPSGEMQKITNDANDYRAFALSADNSTLIVLRNDVRSFLSTFNLQTKESSQITPDYRVIGPYNSNLTQTPSGKIIFVKLKNGDVGNLWMVDADGKNAQAISPDLQAPSNPVVTPDERYIVFSSIQSRIYNIWRTDINGNNLVRLTADENQFDYTPQITTDGKLIVFFRHNQTDNKILMMRMSLDGKDIAPIVGDEPATQKGSLQISPDGKRIAFYLFDTAANKFLLNIAPFDGAAGSIGRAERRLETQGGIIRWSPDEKSITYVAEKGTENLWQMPLDGSNKPKQLTNFTSGKISDFVWSRDGKQLFIIRSTVNSELILIKDAPTK